MKSKILITALFAAALLNAACSKDTKTEPEDSNRLQITVSILPLQYLAERIGGDRVTVQVLIGPGQSPHTYEPTPRQMADLDKASLFVLAGVPYETSLRPRLMAAFPNLTYLSLASELSEFEPHDHGENKAGHDELDPHSWLDPRQTAHQAALLAARLSSLAPKDSTYFAANLNQLHAELADLDTQLAAAFANVPRKRFYVYHPAYGWLADRYGLTQVAIEHEGKEPSPARLATIIAQAQADSVHTIFVQQQIAQPSARAVADAVGARLVVVDPLAPNYLENLRSLALAIETELRR
jgi:zinc transport system substrate-binding protein